jgi:hypothetical protein
MGFMKKGRMVFSSRALVFSIFLSSLTAACYCKGLAAKVEKSSTATPALVPASFVFGDSLVDAGNNNYIRSLARANYPANGIDFPGHVPTGRFTNNRTVADIVGKKLDSNVIPKSCCLVIGHVLQSISWPCQLQLRQIDGL